jgi:hypothetical protein
MPLRAFIAALVFVVALAPACAADTLAYSESFDTLFSVDLTAHTATKIGQATPPGITRLANIEGLTLTPGGALYGVSDVTGTKTLLRIDATTGLATAVGGLTLTGGDTSGQLDLGMAATCDGKLWLSSGTGSSSVPGTGLLWQLDPNTADATLVGNLGAKITGLTARGNQVYGAGSQGNNNFYSVSTSTGAATLLGAYGLSTYITTTSPAFDATGRLWAVLNYVPPPQGQTSFPEWSDLAQINLGNASLTDTGPITGDADFQTNFYGSLKGLAIASSCTAAVAATSQLPTLSWPALGLLVLLVGAFATVQFSRRYPAV